MHSEPLLRCIAAALTALVVSLLGTLAARRIALAHGVLARPTTRGVHREPVPYLGGAGLLVGAVSGIVFLREPRAEVFGLVAGATAVAIVGAVDDIRALPWWLKLGLQVAIALGVWQAGVRIDIWSPPGTQEYVDIGRLSAPLTALWLVLVMNAINFIDGLDGLAAGVGGIAAATIAAIGLVWYYQKGDIPADRMAAAVLASSAAGACAGFLFFNFHPARIFMGDCGALMLGLWLSGLSVMGAFKSTLLYLCPIVLFALPLLDTFWAVVRRVRHRRSPAEADRGHIHHRLLDRVADHRKAVLILYGVSLVFAILAVWIGRP